MHEHFQAGEKALADVDECIELGDIAVAMLTTRVAQAHFLAAAAAAQIHTAGYAASQAQFGGQR